MTPSRPGRWSDGQRTYRNHRLGQRSANLALTSANQSFYCQCLVAAKRLVYNPSTGAHIPLRKNADHRSQHARFEHPQSSSTLLLVSTACDLMLPVTFSLPSRCRKVDEGRSRRSAGRCGSSPVGSVRCGCCTSLLHLGVILTFQCQLQFDASESIGSEVSEALVEIDLG